MVSAEGSAWKSRRTRARRSSNAARAVTRSPASARRRMSSRCPASGSGSPATRSRVHRTAAARSPSFSAWSARLASTSVTLSRWRSRNSNTQSSSRSASGSSRQRSSASSTRPSRTASSKAAASIHTSGLGGIPALWRDATMYAAAWAPSSRRRVASVVRRLVRALSSRTSGQRRPARRERGCRAGLSAIQANSDFARPLLIRASCLPSSSSASSPRTNTRSMA